MRLYHRTSGEAAIGITRGGFRDATGSYLTISGNDYTGVWFSNIPLDVNEGAHGDTVLTLEMPIRLIREYEWIEDGKPYREFLVPAAIVNAHGRIVKVVYDDIEADAFWLEEVSSTRGRSGE